MGVGGGWGGVFVRAGRGFCLCVASVSASVDKVLVNG